MDGQIFPKISDLISKNEAIGIAVGRSQTMDEMAAALSLYLEFTSMNKKVSIASPIDPIVEISSLVGIDKVKRNFEGSNGDLVVSFPYKEGEIEKVSYTLEGGYLNIIVKAGQDGLTFEERDVTYKRGGGAPTLLFVIGTSRLSDLGNLFDPQALKNTTVVNIDNKVDNQGFGDVVYVSPRFSSVSEQVGDFISYLNPQFDPDVAQNLLSGISFATDNFQKPNTSSLAFEMAGILMKNGAKRDSRPQRRDSLDFQKEDTISPFFEKPAQPQPSQRFQPSQAQSQRFQPQQSLQSQGFQPRQSGQGQQSGQNQDPLSRLQQQIQEEKKREEQRQQVRGDQRDDKRDDKNPPSDWLTPKIYKGSTNI